ncbi:nucleotidyltransferase family protein [Proteiniphilum sp.]|uniref:nucleotidyltransferase domain-containing protein n=1 Tax=Proteiniphilum sp. TaxID=1926877 RepID=UPI002B21C4F8|nr:nucleotidyltransferase family protein [Proteiniphilum sp.]MEA4917640.1 nucleotidyltransferase family protein [Proteiniphilum sp.]
MNKPEQQFFALLRCGLWGGLPDKGLFSGATDWDAILAMATMQTVRGILFDAVMELPAGLQPPAQWMRELHRVVIRIEQSHELLHRRIAEVVPLLQSAGIRPVLLKGQGVARNYPNPLRRQCGDIDLYVGEEDYEKACRIVDGWGNVSGKESESLKHAHFRRNGVVVEVHRIAERLYRPVLDNRFQVWTKKQLSGSTLKVLNVKGVDIFLPPVNFNVLYIFNHAYHHFLCGGVGLRQLCDWVMYLNAFSTEIDSCQLETDLKAFGLSRAWRIFGVLAVNELGLPEEKMPLYSPVHGRQSRKVLEKILQSGNFGQYASRRMRRPKGYFQGKWHSLIYMHTHLGAIVLLFPKDVVAYYSYFLYNGVKQVVLDKSGKQYPAW